jgi:hypothetical protein
VTPKKGFYTVKGLDPSGTSECEFKVAAKQVQHLEAHGPAHRYYELISAYEVLKNPLIVFEGLQRHGQEKGLCYVGRPKRYGHDWSAPGHKNMVFLVCLTKEMTIFEWGWEKEDRENPGVPVDVERRFRKAKWKHSSNI